MGAVSNLVLLVCAAGCVSAWEALPNIPAHRRAEYYLLHGDGAYKYGYDTGDGSSHMAQADAANEVRGTYAYTGPSGPVQLAYTAGIGGFVPNLHGAQSSGVAVEAYSASSSSGSATHNANAQYLPPTTHSAQSHAHSTQVQSAQSAYAHSAASQQTTDADYDENADASYAFAIDTDEYKRHEASDPKGNVNGRYSYSGKDGNKVSVTYSAGAGTGFVIENHEGLDAAPAPQITSNRAAVPASPAAIPYHVAPATKISAPAPVPVYNVPAVPITPYSGPLANIVSTGPALDGSYSFSYETPELDRKESADANGLVQGRYSFVAGDGVRRTVDYRAGSLLGYVPQGDGVNPPLPVAPIATAYVNQAAAAHSTYQAQSSHSAHSAQSGYQTSAASQESNEPADASYAFAYEADDHSRKESSDAAGNVEGVYSFTGTDGLSRTVQYVAGANKGFVVQESVAPGAAPKVKAAPAIKAAVPAYVAAPALVASSGYASQQASAHQSAAANAANTDASYSFAYQADDHARQESADAQGNVQGFYSFTALDGINRKIEYQAGANKGFIAKGDHLEVAPVAAVSATRVGAASHASSSGYATQQAVTKHAAVQHTAQVSSHQAAAPVDGSYSFSYDTGSHAHQQSSDPSGYVRGHYSFVADDGVSRSVQYQAGSGTGFVATGSHLPTIDGAAAVVAKSSVSSSSGNSAWSSQTAHAVPAVRAPAPAPIPVARAPVPAEDEKGDASYSYSYQTDTSSKTESSDSQGNVKGTFTFLGGDGQSRTLNYVSGPQSGFVANGAHLPVAPVAPVAGAAVVATKSSASHASASHVGSSIGQGAANSWSATRTSTGSAVAAGGAYGTKTASVPATTTTNFVIHKYLPPDSSHKYGYIFDTRA